MATQAQIDANRKNSQKSTGPTTPEGKARSCMNHVSHGFTSATGFIALEEREEFNALLSDLTSEFQPATPNEQILVEKMVHNQWNSLRAIRLQTIALKASVPYGYIHKDLGILIRYQTASDRAYHKAHAELLSVQKQRKKSDIGFESNKAAEAAQDPAEPPQKPQDPPVLTEKPAPEYPEMPDFLAYEKELAEGLGISVEELKRAA